MQIGLRGAARGRTCQRHRRTHTSIHDIVFCSSWSSCPGGSANARWTGQRGMGKQPPSMDAPGSSHAIPPSTISSAGKAGGEDSQAKRVG
eukprot:355061-Chlamydomonas_euryale.AAC.4